jgi:hypothetical protein
VNESERERDECCMRQDPVESELSSGLESDERKEANVGMVLLASGFGPGLVHGEGRWAVSQAGFEKYALYPPLSSSHGKVEGGVGHGVLVCYAMA